MPNSSKCDQISIISFQNPNSSILVSGFKTFVSMLDEQRVHDVDVGVLRLALLRGGGIL